MSESAFRISVPGSGDVSAVLSASDKPIALLILGHGAGADMHHRHMQAISDSLVGQDIAVLRFNFPFKEAGGHRVDAMTVCLETIGAASDLARTMYPNLPLFLGGHSFGGRMASHYAAEQDSRIKGLVYYSFPLHVQKKPAITRAAHLSSINAPQLFLSGTRDALADPVLLREVVAGLKHARLHELDTADHGFKILKRSRKSEEDVYTEAARTVRTFIASLLD